MEKINKPNNRLRYEREARGWSQEELSEKVGTNHVNISRWETGASSPGPYFRKKLCEVFGKDAYELGLMEEGTDQSNGNMSPATSSVGLSSHTSHHQSTIIWPTSLSNERYYPLPGRETDLARLVALLQSPPGPLVLTIDGLGGLGKTAMALELARRLLQEKRFAGVVGESAKQEFFSGGKIVQIREARLDLDFLLDAIARQLGRWELRTFKREEKHAIIRTLLQQTPYLVLVDNLETAENSDALVFSLQSLLGVSRAIVTSRKQVLYDFVHMHSLKALTWEDSLFFLQKEMEHHSSEQLQHIPEEHLNEIYVITGGAPLALKLVIAQTQFLDLKVILQRLRNAGSKLYPFIYRQSWEQLSLLAQHLLIYIGQTVETTVGWEELMLLGQDASKSEEQLVEALNELVAYSLLDVSEKENQKRYGMHQLTRQFVNSDLPQMWKEQRLL